MTVADLFVVFGRDEFRCCGVGTAGRFLWAFASNDGFSASFLHGVCTYKTMCVHRLMVISVVDVSWGMPTPPRRQARWGEQISNRLACMRSMHGSLCHGGPTVSTTPEGAVVISGLFGVDYWRVHAEVHRAVATTWFCGRLACNR